MPLASMVVRTPTEVFKTTHVKEEGMRARRGKRACADPENLLCPTQDSLLRVMKMVREHTSHFDLDLSPSKTKIWAM